MNKYQLLAILNMPFVFYGLLMAVKGISTKQQNKIREVIVALFWIIIGVSLIFAKNIYEFLVDKALTDSDPISIVDVMLITAVIFLLYQVIRDRRKIHKLEERVSLMMSFQSIENHILKSRKQ